MSLATKHGQSDLIWPRVGTAFRNKCHAALGALGVGAVWLSALFKPYSIRRGELRIALPPHSRWTGWYYVADGVPCPLRACALRTAKRSSSIRLSQHAKSRLATFTRGLPPQLLPWHSTLREWDRGRDLSWTCHVSSFWPATCHAWFWFCWFRRIQPGPIGLFLSQLQPEGWTGKP